MGPAGDIRYTRIGAGDPLVLVHGLGSRREAWDPVLPRLTPHRDVLALDLPGFGTSPGPAPVDAAGRVTVETLAGAVAGLLHGLGLAGADRPHLAGFSLGGGIALELGRRGLARSVTAFAPVGFWALPGRLWCQTCLRGIRGGARRAAPVLPAVLATTAGRVVLGGGFYGRPAAVSPQTLLDDAAALVDGRGFDAACAGLAGHRFEAGSLDGLAEVPVTLAWGSRDLLLPFASQARRARLALPGARRVLLPGCGHLPFADDPVRCAQVLLSSHQSPLAGGG